MSESFYLLYIYKYVNQIMKLIRIFSKNILFRNVNTSLGLGRSLNDQLEYFIYALHEKIIMLIIRYSIIT